MTVRVTSLKGAAAGQYYVAEAGSYYLAAGQPAGRWFGVGASRLGLNSSFDDDAFVAVMAGVDPCSGVELGRPFVERSVRGYDVTFSAPKCLSLLAAVGDPVVAAEVYGAHDAAVDAVLGYVERHALTRYRVDGEVMSVDAEGLVVGVFREHVSRELDPQLHSHAVIANRVLSPDGRWLALDARALMKDQTVLSSLYHAGLRAELTARLGVGWQDPVNGIAEMHGVDEVVLQEFSQRSLQVAARTMVKLDRFRESLGRQPTGRERWRLEREAVLDSRRSKPAPVDAAELRVRWVEQLASCGLEPDGLVAAVIGRTMDPPRELDPAGWHQVADQALDALSDARSTWRHPDVVREFARATPTDLAVPAGVLVEGLEAAAGGFAAERLVEFARPLPEGTAVRLSDGRPAWESPLERRYTTSFILDEEAHLAQWAKARWALPGHAGYVEVGGLLDCAQQAAAEAVGGDAPLVVIVGPAGTGKTTALRPGIDALAAHGRPVFAVAPTATAAAVLTGETGVAADTVHKLLHEHHRPGGPSPRYRLPAGATLLVDEAAMVATPILAELAVLADRGRWRVVLVGDPLQYLPVGRGGMFDWLVEHGPTIELGRVHRFSEPWERQASLALRHGDTDALTIYEQHGRLHRGVPGEMDFDVLDHWARLRAGGESVVVLAANNDTVARLNDLAQHHRIQAGELDDHGPSVVTDAGVRLLVGDEIATRHNDRRLRTDQGEMVRNHDQWTITTINKIGDLTATGRAGRVRLPAGYVASHVELAYAQTGHAAQGRTVDHSLLIVDGNIDNRGVYVPLTRGRRSNHAYVALEADDPRSARDVLAEAVCRDWADIPAITYRHQLQLAVPADGPPAAVPQRPLDPSKLPEVARGLAQIDLLDVPFQQGELQRSVKEAARQRNLLADAVAKLEPVKVRRDEVGEQLVGMSPWNPFAGRRRHQLEHDFHKAASDVPRARRAIRDLEPDLAAADAEVGKRQGLVDRFQPVFDRRPELQASLDRDLHARICLAGEEPAPLWALQVLGPRPDRQHSAQVWDQAIGVVEQYRTIAAITDHDHPLGREPGLLHPNETPRRSAAATLRWATVELDREQFLNRQLRRDLGFERSEGLGISM
ncbi:MAG: MobF family relaxase [Acidimicrobiales bacterium]